MTNTELIDSIINDLNAYLKALASGEHLKACAIMTGITQRLINLRTGVENDMKNRDETIAKLKDVLRSHGIEIVDVAPEELC